MKEHDIDKFVNELTSTAKLYGHTEQLREHIKSVVISYIIVEKEPVRHKHDWVCRSVGLYDSLYQCKTCKKEFIDSVDVPERIRPEYGCTK